MADGQNKATGESRGPMVACVLGRVVALLVPWCSGGGLWGLPIRVASDAWELAGYDQADQVAWYTLGRDGAATFERTIQTPHGRGAERPRELSTAEV